MTEIEETITRISKYEEVDRILIIKAIENEDSIDSIIMRSMNSHRKEQNNEEEKRIEEQYAKVVPLLAIEARSFIRQLDAKNDLTFLRIRTTDHEVLIDPDKDFYLCVLQNMKEDRGKEKEEKTNK